MLAWRGNPSLFAGIALPAVLAGWLCLTHYLPRLAVPDPQYDMLYLTNYASGAVNTLHVDVLHNRVAATFVGENFGYGWPQLYRFHAKTGLSEEIPIPRPRDVPLVRPYNRPDSDSKQEPAHPVPLPGVDNLKIDPATLAPDHYLFRTGENRSSPFTLWEGDNDAFAYIMRGPKQFPIPAPPGAGRPTPLFLGWIVP